MRKGIESGETRVVKKRTMSERMEQVDMSIIHLGFTWVGWFLTLFILISGQPMESSLSLQHCSLVELTPTERESCLRLQKMDQRSALQTFSSFIHSF